MYTRSARVGAFNQGHGLMWEELMEDVMDGAAEWELDRAAVVQIIFGGRSGNLFRGAGDEGREPMSVVVDASDIFQN